MKEAWEMNFKFKLKQQWQKKNNGRQAELKFSHDSVPDLSGSGKFVAV